MPLKTLVEQSPKEALSPSSKPSMHIGNKLDIYIMCPNLIQLCLRVLMWPLIKLVSIQIQKSGRQDKIKNSRLISNKWLSKQIVILLLQQAVLPISLVASWMIQIKWENWPNNIQQVSIQIVVQVVSYYVSPKEPQTP